MAVGIACNGHATDGGGTSGGDCSMQLVPYDAQAACRSEPTQVDGICFSNVATGKGLYMLCAVNDSGAMFVLDVSSDQQFNASNWSFGPQTIATGVFHLPPISDSYEAACLAAAQHPTTESIPLCASDAGPE